LGNFAARKRLSSGEPVRRIGLLFGGVTADSQAMIEVEVYAAGVRAPEKMMGLALELEAFTGLRYKVDTNHDIVYMEFTGSVPDADSIRTIFKKIELEAKFVGQLPPEVSEKKKTQRIDLGEGV